MTPSDEAKPKSVITGENKEHSRKPDEVYEIIERMYPDSVKLEMFARRNREGWTSFGNENN
jgi:N6-adenosine-specific RNA methylase IME4